MHEASRRRRVVVTGMGVVAANGAGREAFWEATSNAESGVRRIDRFDTAGFSSRIAGLVDGFDPLNHVSAKVARMTDRSTQFALAASSEAVEDSGLALPKGKGDSVAVSIGAGLGGMMFYEEQILLVQERGIRRASPLCVPRIMPNAPAAHVAMQHGARGPNLTTSTACSSGAHAVGRGLRLVRDGTVEVAICGGTEACVCFHSFRAFDCMRVMSTRNDEPTRASRPFDRDRDGFVMGEGSGILVLEELAHARARGARVYAEILGYGASAGAHHVVMPVPDGGDAARAMQAALDDAQLDRNSVDYINAHGTSTKANDRSETLAIKRTFGERAYSIPISSTKSVIGHTIGASGAIDAVVCALAISRDFVPPTANYENTDPECDLDYVPDCGRDVSVSVALSNSFGFGNNNAVLVLGKES